MAKISLEKSDKHIRANPNAVKHGCVDCVYRETPANKFPCSLCDTKNDHWYYWTDRTKEATISGKQKEKAADKSAELQLDDDGGHRRGSESEPVSGKGGSAKSRIYSRAGKQAKRKPR